MLGPEDPFMRFAADAIIVPVEAALMAILAVTLVYASIRLLRRRRGCDVGDLSGGCVSVSKRASFWVTKFPFG